MMIAHGIANLHLALIQAVHLEVDSEALVVAHLVVVVHLEGSNGNPFRQEGQVVGEVAMAQE